jgi:hypothetical protein
LDRADFTLKVFGFDFSARQSLDVLLDRRLQAVDLLACPVNIKLGIDCGLRVLAYLVEGCLHITRCRGAEQQEQCPSAQSRPDHPFLHH